MIYLDYSATTKPSDEVLEIFNNVEKNYYFNTNSKHMGGIKAREILNDASNKIKSLLKLNSDFEIIYTSGATESNNLAIKGLLKKEDHMITTSIEHSSIINTASTLCDVSYVKLNNGYVDLDNLKNTIKKNTRLVSIGVVNSEVGLVQNIKEIYELLKDYPSIKFHIDATQAIGKLEMDYNNCDLFSMSAHKIYGLKGIGMLVSRKNVNFKNIIDGGSSYSKFRSGTMPLGLIAGLTKALSIEIPDIKKHYEYILTLNETLRNYFNDFTNININSNELCMPHILNISVKNIKAEVLINALSKKEIYVSSKSACSKSLNEESNTLKELNLDKEYLDTSIRISLSYKTTMDEINIFMNEFKIIINELGGIKNE